MAGPGEQPEELLGPWELRTTLPGVGASMWVELAPDGSASCARGFGRGFAMAFTSGSSPQNDKRMDCEMNCSVNFREMAAEFCGFSETAAMFNSSLQSADFGEILRKNSHVLGET